ncbi:hypothetical protein ASZ90_017580 [hydrocarbon metagenome]|uniref:Uncharacterized protein n=1 Tax=hydrocarbon metagenome TaxID=938273 RepID=A0A0W8E8L5_9ZZZZ
MKESRNYFPDITGSFYYYENKYQQMAADSCIIIVCNPFIYALVLLAPNFKPG